jgi:hypothetical protein
LGIAFGIGTGIGLSVVACANADAFGIGTGIGLSVVACADAEAFGIGTERGMSVLTCADAAAMDRTPKINNVEIVFFMLSFLLQVVTRLLRARNSKNRGPEFRCTRWFGRAKGEGCESVSESFKRIVLTLPGGAIFILEHLPS